MKKEGEKQQGIQCGSNRKQTHSALRYNNDPKTMQHRWLLLPGIEKREKRQGQRKYMRTNLRSQHTISVLSVLLLGATQLLWLAPQCTLLVLVWFIICCRHETNASKARSEWTASGGEERMSLCKCAGRYNNSIPRFVSDKTSRINFEGFALLTIQNLGELQTVCFKHLVKKELLLGKNGGAVKHNVEMEHCDHCKRRVFSHKFT